MPYAWRWLPVVCLLLLGCDTDGMEAENEPETPRSAIGLNQDSEFVYRWTVSEVDTTSGLETFLFQDDYVIRIVNTEEQVGDQQGLIHVTVTSSSDAAATSTTWYRETTTQLIDVAYRNAALTPTVAPKRFTSPWSLPLLTAPHLSPQPRHNVQGVHADSIIIRDDPRIVLQFPMDLGTQWTSFTAPFQQTREVVALDTVTTPAGTFPCVQVQTASPTLSASLNWRDCISEEGLILRFVENDATDGAGSIRVRERLELITKTE